MFVDNYIEGEYVKQNHRKLTYMRNYLARRSDNAKERFVDIGPGGRFERSG